jgi:hypothetical protein
LTISAVLAALALGPPWLLALVPEPARRRVAIRFLELLLIGHSVVAVVAPIGLVLSGAMLVRARGRGTSRALPLRVGLLCGSVAIGLGLSEVGAAAWLGWIHRWPALTTTFEPTDESQAALPAAPGLGSGASDEVEIVVIGGSSARGAPYQGYLSFGEIVGWQLERSIPGRRFHVDVLARPAAPLEAMRQALTGLKRRPDAMIIYSGHNEFYAYDNWKRIVPYYEDEIDPQSAWTLRERIDHATPLRELMSETLERRRQQIAPDHIITRPVVDRPSCTAEEYARRLASFRDHLETMVAFCERVKCLPILVMPAGNEGGFEPNRSVLARHTTKHEREVFARKFLAARSLEATDPERGMQSYRRLLARQPGFAEADFRLARLLEASGAWAEANRHYHLARDHDGLPLRCPSPFLNVYRKVAARHPGAIVIDGPAVLRAISPHGILDDHVFNDGQHPALVGYIALAQAILDQLFARRAFGWPHDAARQVIDPVACASHFHMDAAAWAEVCNRAAWFLGGMAYIRHDPTERLAKAKRLDEAACAIATGTPPEATGVPGIGVLPLQGSHPSGAG